MDKIKKKELYNLFVELDKDKNGFIDRKEFQEYVKKMCHKVTKNETDIIFALMDENSDGKIYIKEFLRAFEAV